jgi:DUF1680 family protein
LDQIWNDLIGSKFYLTGGIGAEAGHEGFGASYDLPNLTAYNETCASIGEIYWNSRMFLIKGESSYFDILERVLYNGLISGVSLSGDHFFYPNPLASEGKYLPFYPLGSRIRICTYNQQDICKSVYWKHSVYRYE